MQTDEATGQKTTIVTEMLKELPVQTISEITKWFQRVECCHRAHTCASAETGFRGRRAVALMKVMGEVVLICGRADEEQ